MSSVALEGVVKVLEIMHFKQEACITDWNLKFERHEWMPELH